MERNTDRDPKYDDEQYKNTDGELEEILLGGRDDHAGVIFYDGDAPKTAWVQSDTVVEVEP